MFNVSALLLDDALKPATPLIAPLVNGVAGLSAYMYDVVVKSSRSLSHFLTSSCSYKLVTDLACHAVSLRQCDNRPADPLVLAENACAHYFCFCSRHWQTVLFLTYWGGLFTLCLHCGMVVLFLSVFVS